MHFNGIDDDTIRSVIQFFPNLQVIPFIKHVKCPKNYYLFLEGERSKRFYGIIKGRISLRTQRLVDENIVLPTQSNTNNNNNVNNSSKKAYFVSNNKLANTNNLNNNNNITMRYSQPTTIINDLIRNRDSTIRHSTIVKKKLSTKKSTITQFKIDHDFTPYNVNVKEREIMQVWDGMCFGEWAILYNQLRKASALAIEDTDLFYIDKHEFDNYLTVMIER